MSDLIDRQAAIDEAEEWIETYNSGRGGQRERDAIKHVISGIKTMPSAQPEVTEEDVKEYCRKRCLCIVDSALLKKYASAQPEIIRCKGCKYWREDHTCREHSLVSPMMADEFCSRAERREG